MGIVKKITLVPLLLLVPWLIPDIPAEEPFRATIYLQGSNKKVLLYRKYNQQEKKGNTEILRHIYTFPDGRLAVREEVVMINGAFSRYNLLFKQANCGCVLERIDDQVVFTFTGDGKQKKGTASYSDNLVVGPVLSDFVRSRWGSLMAGGRVLFRIPVMNRQIIAQFYLKRIYDSGYERKGVVVIEMKISGFILGLLIKPNQLVFDSATKRLMEIHGPTLLKRRVKGKWENTNADIYYEYTR